MKFKFGIIGAGGIARRFCRAVRMVPDADVTAVASSSRERGEKFAAEMQVGQAYDDYAAMLRQANIDGVYIATTHNFHFANAMLCCEHRKPFICEKPFVLTRREAETAFAAARAQNIFSMEAMWSRFLPAVQQAKQWIAAGRLGEIQLASSSLGFASPPDAQGRLRNKALAGGALYDIGVYCIELLTYLVGGEVANVAADNVYGPTGVDLTNNVNFRCGGVPVNFQCSIAVNTDVGIDIYGSKGRLHFSRVFDNRDVTFIPAEGAEEKFTADFPEGFTYEIQEMIAGVRSGKLESSIIPHADTVQCAEIFEQCLR